MDIDELFGADGFVPRWHCGNWSDKLGWTTIIADITIAFCYFAIPLVLVWIARQRGRDWLSRVFLSTAAFVGLCGTIHVCDAIIFWWPIYPVQTVTKVATAAVSFVAFLAFLRTAKAIGTTKTDSQVRKLVEERTRMLEEQARVRQMAEESVRSEVERIMRELAHDLKEPARAIASFTEIVLDRGDDLDDERRKDFLARANRGAHRIIDMIQEMRSYALATAGNRNGSIEMIPFRKVVDEALGRMDRKIELSEASIKTVIGVDDKSLVAESVIRVIQNLVENSIKYSLEGQNPKIWLSATEERDQVLVEVRDDGMGFNKESAGHIFEPFHRLKPHDEKAGVGMGLAISHNIVTKLGGRIWAQSDGEGKGAAVFFRVPIQTESEVEDEQVESTDGPAR